MPRFYSDVREGPSFTPDEEGFEFDSLERGARGSDLGGGDRAGSAAEG